MNPYVKSRLPLDITSKEFFKFSHSTVAAYAVAFIMENLYCTQCMFEQEDPADAPFIGNRNFLSDAAHTKKVAKAEWNEEMNDYVAPFEEWFRYLTDIKYPLEGAILEWCNQQFLVSQCEKQGIEKEKRSPQRIELEGMLKVLIETFPSVPYKSYATFPSVKKIADALDLQADQIENIAKNIDGVRKKIGRPPNQVILDLKNALSHLKSWLDEV